MMSGGVGCFGEVGHGGGEFPLLITCTIFFFIISENYSFYYLWLCMLIPYTLQVKYDIKIKQNYKRAGSAFRMNRPFYLFISPYG